AVPTKSSLEAMLGKAHLWPPDAMWDFHSGRDEFHDLHRFNHAMDEIYGAPSGLDDYLRKAQAMAYDSERAMFEAYSGQRYSSTGVVQWMLNNAWPSLIWHLYDHNLSTGGGYFGARKANEPVHIQFSTVDRS